MDDYFAHDNALQVIVDNFEGEWLVTGCLHQHSNPFSLEEPHSPHYAEYTDDIHRGNNRLGSPSVVTLRNQGHLPFDEKLSFLLDCDLYKRYYATYGQPKLLSDLNVIIGVGEHQTTYKLSDKQKTDEFYYLKEKYA